MIIVANPGYCTANAHIEGLGFNSANAALLMRLVFGFAALGKVRFGLAADRISARRELAGSYGEPRLEALQPASL
jgi:hypothetical protein